MTFFNQGISCSVRTFKQNAWDDEVKKQVDEVKEVVTPLARSTQSLAIDRKQGLIEKQQKIYADVAQTPPEERTREQELLLDMTATQAAKLEREKKELEALQALPLFSTASEDEE